MPPLDAMLLAIAFGLAAFAGSHWQRTRTRRRQGHETARGVEAERIIALLSARQPGVWDQEDLRDRVQQIARDYWTLPTREDMARLESWVSPELLQLAQRQWPGRADSREVNVKFVGPVSFVQVNEGGPGPDRLIARLRAQADTQWMDAQGKLLKRERQGSRTTYHAWIHIDGQGWQLSKIQDAPAADEPPPSSVSCRILPAATEEESQPRHQS